MTETFETQEAGQAVDSEERNIAAKLFKVRTKLDIGRSELAKAAGISALELKNYELAVEAIPASTLAVIASALGINFEYFYSEDLEFDEIDRAISSFGSVYSQSVQADIV